MILVLIWLLTLAMVVDCVALVFLVLIQLPKKEAGAGLAFGGGATDALFGAGSGNVLTKITKYFAGGFFVLSIVLSLLWSAAHSRGNSRFLNTLSAPGHAAAPADTTPAAAAAVPVAAKPVTGTNAGLLLSTPTATSTNKPLLTVPVESTNVPAAPAAPAAGAAK